MKSNQTVEHVHDPKTRVSVFKVKGREPLTLEYDKISPENLARATVFGIDHVRVIDGAAISRADKDGNIRSAEELAGLKHAAMGKIIAHLASGSPVWEMPRAGARAVAPVALEIVLLALERVYKLTREQVNTKLVRLVTAHGGDLEAHARKLAESSRIAGEIAAILAERIKPAVDAAALEDEFLREEPAEPAEPAAE